jgi:hypothetical protein
MSRNRRDVRCGFFVQRSGSRRTDMDLENFSFAIRKTGSNQPVFALTARIWAL